MKKRQPDPEDYEGQDDFMERCVIELIDDGTDPDEAVSECEIAWSERSHAVASKKWPVRATWRGQYLPVKWRDGEY